MKTLPVERLQSFLRESRDLELATGMKRGELLGLKWESFDLQSGMGGHFSVSFTLDTYVHVTGAAQRQAAQMMAGVLGGR